jgi:hypothetical protein
MCKVVVVDIREIRILIIVNEEIATNRPWHYTECKLVFSLIIFVSKSVTVTNLSKGLPYVVFNAQQSKSNCSTYSYYCQIIIVDE